MLTIEIQRQPGPRYQAIIHAVSEAITSGRLAARERLPTHRELARQLGLDVGTVSRAYAELRRQGLISGEVGRGTFVAEIVRDAPQSISETPAEPDFIDLSHNFPFGAPCSPRIAPVLATALDGCDVDRIMTYQVDLGQRHHREAGRAWLAFQGLPDGGGEIAVTAGAQHGLLLAVSALTRPGDRVLTEAVTYFGLKSIAALLGLELVPVEVDAEGLVPASLAEAGRGSGARVLCCSPTLHNPTTSLMSEARREEIAQVSRELDLHVVEDDVYGFLLEPRVAPICSLVPERTFYVTSLSKCIGPGLRVGFVRFPAEHAERVGLAMRATTLMASPVMAEITARMIGDGTAARIASELRQEVAQRQEIAGRLLAGCPVRRHPWSFHVWMQMTNGWHAREFTSEARRLGVGVAPGELFAVSPTARPDAVRLCISAAHDRAQMEKALSVLTRLLATPWRPATPPV